MEKLFSSFSMKYSVNAFYNQLRGNLPVSKDLLFKYYKYFNQSMLIFEVRKYVESMYARMRNPPKLYIIDNGLARRVKSEDSGRLLENAVFLELKRRGYELFYYDDSRECDFIAKGYDNNVDIIQSCYELTDENREREVLGLTDACKRLQRDEGMIITANDEENMEVEGIKIKTLPFYKWAIRSEAN